MSKAKTIVIALFLGVVMMFGVAGCNSDAQNELNKKISDLESRIEQMEESLAERDSTIEDLNDQIKKSDERIEQMERELAEKTDGAFYTLQEAYDMGWLTKANVMRIAYYHNGGRIYNEEIMSETYKPLPKTPEVLSNLTESKIKSTAAKEYREKYNMQYAEVDGFRITEYCGTYGDCVAVMLRDDYSDAASVYWIDSVAGVNIKYFDGNSIQIWRVKEKEPEGPFYTLYEAYGYGHLTKEDLQKISIISKWCYLDEPDDLEIQQAIKKDYFEIFKKTSTAQRHPEATVEDMCFWKYFGEYHGYFVAQLSDAFSEYFADERTYDISDIIIYYSGPDILVWKYN